jgi:hypothetical protein
MTIELTQTLYVAGLLRDPGYQLTLEYGEEAAYVHRGVARWVGDDASQLPAPPPLLARPAVAGQAMPLPAQPLHIADSSALDLRHLRKTAVPAGARGRVQIHGTDSTKLAEASVPTVPVRIFLATWAPSQTHGPLPLDKARITAGLEHLANCGYNAVRIHGLEYWLCSGSGNDGDFYFPEARLDAFDFFLAEAKRLGLYWVFNPRQPELYQAGPSRFSMPGSALNFKHRIFVQQNARDHYIEGFNRLYNRRNAYTGINMMQDPALLMVQWFNECTTEQLTESSWPAVWIARESARGTAALTWREWLADPAQAHGYADLAALNTDWSTSHASFDAIPTPASRPTVGAIGSNNEAWAIALYARYLDEHLAQFFEDFAASISYQGLGSTLHTSPSLTSVRTIARTDANAVSNPHDYTFTTPTPAVGAVIAIGRQNTPVWGYSNWIAGAGAYSAGKPSVLFEHGWPYWGDYRNQFPIFAALASLQGASGQAFFHQGGFFEERFEGDAVERIARLFPYEGHSDPVARFTGVASFFLFHREAVAEGAYLYELTFNDRYMGTSPRVGGRLTRGFQRVFAPVSSIALVARTRIEWEADTTSDALAATLNAQDWYTHLNALLTAAAITADNLGLVSATANRGNVAGVEISGTVGSVTASATQPVLEIGSNSLADGDQIAVTSLTGSGGTWPGTNNRNVRATMRQTGVSGKVQITSGLNLTGTSGFTAGTWCELDNVVQSAGKEIFMSRRAKVAAVSAPKFKYFADGGANSAIYPYSEGLTGFSVVSCTAGAACFIAALDDTALDTSQDMLLGLVGKARNAGESYTTSANTTFATIGDWPIVIDEVTAVLKLTRALWGRYVLEALALNGNVLASTELATEGTSLVIPLATAPYGAVFFRIRRRSV